jgi:hypothetical protein
LRSPSADAAGADFSAGASSGISFWPQPLQKLLSGGFVLLHCGQVLSSLRPHLLQKLASAGLSDWHTGHCIFLFPIGEEL